MAAGSIYKKGKYYYAVISYHDTKGERRRDSRATKKTNKKDAKVELKKLIEEYRQFENAYQPDVYMSNFILTWLNTKRAALRPNTFNDYTKTIYKHLIPWFAERRLFVADVKAHHIEELKEVLLKKVSVNTARTIIGYVSMVLKYAVKNDLVSRNVAEGVSFPRKQKRFKANYYDLEQMKTLLHMAEDTNIEMPTVLMCYLGLRKSEALGLKWSSIDWKAKTVTIKDTIVMNAGSILCAENTKTQASRRTLYMPAPLMKALKRERERQKKDELFCGNCYTNSGYICRERTGAPTRPDRFYERFKRFLAVNGLPDIRVHDLRHSAASLFLELGLTVKEVSDQLGHSSVEVTNRYLHSSNESKRVIADKVSEAFGMKSRKSSRKIAEKKSEDAKLIYLPKEEKTPQTPEIKAFVR